MYYTLGIIAHVDAGKTTFCEQLLYCSHTIRSKGRVDQGTSFMDHHPIERKRGITIFSSEASFQLNENTYQLIDTPGHVDFSGEMERALLAVDACILIISAVEGIQSHSRTVWHLLQQKNIPVLIFINKTDRIENNGDELLDLLQQNLSPLIADFRNWQKDETWVETVAEKRDDTLEAYLDGAFHTEAAKTALSKLFLRNKIVPVVAGSALNGNGVNQVLSLVDCVFSAYSQKTAKDDAFSAIVYKVRHHSNYGRMVFFRILSGDISTRSIIGNEKITNLYITQGEKLIAINQAVHGMLCIATGLTVPCGSYIGTDKTQIPMMTEPMLESEILACDATSPIRLLQALRILEDEDPLLHVHWQQRTQRIKVRTMGKVQLEVLQEILSERFNMSVSFGTSSVVYLETPAEPSIGVGHYEPLRHYAEVRLLVKPGERGSGICFQSQCHVDFLADVWQKQIKEIILKEKHTGVLSGALLTDAVIVLLNGRAHPKHTEGGDFYEATRRAVRNALMKGRSILLEPYCSFTVSAPKEFAGILQEKAKGLFSKQIEFQYENIFQMKGLCPVATFMEFYTLLPSLTRGNGIGWWLHAGYQPCHNEQQVIADCAYQPLSDLENPVGSIFCAKGAGFYVEWDHVEEWAHTDSYAHY